LIGCKREPPSSRRRRVAYLGALVLCLATVVARRPDTVLLPQFWAEDGTTFYQPAFEGRTPAVLLEPYSGYLHLLPRLVAWVAALVPPERAPAVFNTTAVLGACLCVWLFTLPLARPLLASDALRLAVALQFILSNPAVETFGNMANLQWWMCLGTLTLISVPLQGRWLVPLACGLVAMAALSSPMPVLFVPVAILAMAVGGRRYWAAGITLLVGAGVQVLARQCLTGHEPDLPEARSVSTMIAFTLNASYATLIQLIPGYGLAVKLADAIAWAGCVGAGLLFILLVARALWPWSRRQALLVGGAVYLLGIASAVSVLTRWLDWPSAYLLNTPMPLGGRYAFLPYAACVFLLGLAVQQGLRAPTWRGRLGVMFLFAVAALCSIGGRPPMIELVDLEWSRHVQEARDQGEAVIPINPAELGWSVELKMQRK